MDLCKENISNIRMLSKQFEVCLNQILPYVDLVQRTSYVDCYNPTCLAMATTLSTLGLTLKTETDALKRNILHNTPPQSPPDHSSASAPYITNINPLVYLDPSSSLPPFHLPSDVPVNHFAPRILDLNHDVPKSSRNSCSATGLKNNSNNINNINAMTVPAVDLKKRKRVKVTTEKKVNYVCRSCGARETPEWRKGPLGKKTLCNACGLRWAKALKNQAEQERVYLQYVERLNEYTQEQLHLAVNQKMERRENWEDQRREIENLNHTKQEMEVNEPHQQHQQQHQQQMDSPVRDRRADINFLLN